MTKRNVIISSFVAVAIAVVAIANMGTARFTVIVLDEQTRRPIEDVDVIGCFANHYLRWENASEEIVHHKHTDRNGRCAFWGKTNCGEAGVRVRRYPGYYDSEILHIPYGKIYGDIEVRQKYDGEIPSIVGVAFLYYLNTTSLDRNLEYKTGANLNLEKLSPIDGQLKP